MRGLLCMEAFTRSESSVSGTAPLNMSRQRRSSKGKPGTPVSFPRLFSFHKDQGHGMPRPGPDTRRDPPRCADSAECPAELFCGLWAVGRGPWGGVQIHSIRWELMLTHAINFERLDIRTPLHWPTDSESPIALPAQQRLLLLKRCLAPGPGFLKAEAAARGIQ
jgi:hypothetical protein